MLNQTRRALKDFDNPHEFERLAAALLLGLGYAEVEPMAPGGGADGGEDIRFRDGDQSGIAFVTLDKRIREKFRRDLAKRVEGEGTIALFCNVEVSPGSKLEFTKLAVSKGYMLAVYDLERLTGLLDTLFPKLRSKYLNIPGEVRADVIVEYWTGSRGDPNGAGLIVHNVGDDVALAVEAQRLTPENTFDASWALKSLKAGERSGIALGWEYSPRPKDAPEVVPPGKYMTRVGWADRSGDRHLGVWTLTDKR